MTNYPFKLLEQFIQIASAGPYGVDAGNLICKGHKEELADMGLVTPKYGTGFRLTQDGERVWQNVKRIISYTDPWYIKERLCD